ncbi:hypothetical protein [Ectopseudomonas oleovorans]|uniref:Uncharacterized protein n=1 Tax=Ectopseudomonas oleovorans TaxID=301 RepID=A0A3D9EFT2_ECTOL|nr:hypothetical protein [Pseudomonas oleovorans]RED02023.1 hypothetical protein DFO60_3648 [Pseudomonas oleovorans]
MRRTADDIPVWLAGLSDRTLQRLNSRITYLLRMIDMEKQRRENQHCVALTEELLDVHGH